MRIILENKDFVITSPYAPRFPFEAHILPKVHDSCFEEAQSYEYESLAKITKRDRSCFVQQEGIDIPRGFHSST